MVEFSRPRAPPPEAVLAGMKAAGFNVTHLYGLTETYGPAAVNDWHAEWDKLDLPRRPRRRPSGRALPAARGARRIDPDTMAPVPRDGQTIGEIMSAATW